MSLGDRPSSDHCPPEQPTIAQDPILCLLRIGIGDVVGYLEEQHLWGGLICCCKAGNIDMLAVMD
jgi:hypothetical protein